MGINNIRALVDQSTDEAHDDTDVPACLARETFDGPGTTDRDSLPPSDFVEEEE